MGAEARTSQAISRIWQISMGHQAFAILQNKQNILTIERKKISNVRMR